MELNKTQTQLLELLRDYYDKNKNIFDPSFILMTTNISKDEFVLPYYTFLKEKINEYNFNYKIANFFLDNKLYEVDWIKEDILKNDTHLKEIFFKFDFDAIKFLVDNEKFDIIYNILENNYYSINYPIYKFLNYNIENNQKIMDAFLKTTIKKEGLFSSDIYDQTSNLTKHLIDYEKFEECNHIIKNYKSFIITDFITVEYLLKMENITKNKSKIEYLIKNNDVLKLNQSLLDYALKNNKNSLLNILSKEDDFEENVKKINNHDFKEKIENHFNKKQNSKIKRSIKTIISEKTVSKKRKM